jgi:protein gp37
MAYRLAGMKNTVYNRLKLAGLDAFAPAFHWEVHDKLVARLSTVKPRRVFIASMGDIGSDTPFHMTDNKTLSKYGMPAIFILDRIFRLCIKFPQHTFLLLSKNPSAFSAFKWPKNAQVGTSIDSCGPDADERLSELYKVNADVRWVSIEPLLDPKFNPYQLAQNYRLPDWVVIGGLSGKKPLPEGCIQAAERIVDWCKVREIPVFVKDNMISDHDWPKEIL